jgi:hypothetical protein
MRYGPKKRLALYAVLPSDQLAKLRNTPGGDEARVALLAGQLGAQLLGRTTANLDTTAMLQAVIK